MFKIEHHRSRKDSKSNSNHEGLNKSPVSRHNSTKRGKSPSKSPSSKTTTQLKCCICSGSKLGQSPSRINKITSSTSPLRSSLTMTDDARQLRRERDELQVLLDKFEHHMAEVIPLLLLFLKKVFKRIPFFLLD